ncbi:hypothetical protein [Lysinibacillus parviboronicapiens]|uniref:hypothetical protein n=1 Tax=Lysinibacillus parviboronicapiens TaxID=436516 RepID=UPI000D361B00|nr:hypothetical protein [Lysinibacillus parviboronicapiens]
MNKNASQTIVLICGYSLMYFGLTTIIYFLGLLQNTGGINLPLFGGGDDGIFYYEQATNIANDLSYIYTSVHTVILGWILKYFNTDSVYLLRIFNYFANLGLVIVSLLILKKIIKRKAIYWISSWILLILLTFYPSLILNTTISLYRDIWIYFYFLWCMYLFINIFIENGKYPKIINIILFILTMFMLGGYRKYALLSFLLGSTVYLLIKLTNKNKIRLKKYTYIFIFGFTIFYIFLKNVKFPIVNLSLSDALLYRQSSLDAGGSQMGISLDQSNMIMFYVNYLYSFISNFIGPLPWQITGGSTLILMLTEGSVFLVISIFLFRRRKMFSNIEKYLIIQSVIWFLLISISNDNIGTSSRLRIVGWLPLLIVFSKYYGEYLFAIRKRKQMNLKQI